MAISAYTGLPGSYKSYSVVFFVILKAMREGRPVMTNIPLNLEVFEKEFGVIPDIFTTEDIKRTPDWWNLNVKPGCVFILDECWSMWPSGMKASAIRQEDKSFLAEHRHLVADGRETDIVFVVQDLNMVAMFARTLVEITFRMHKHVQLGQSTRFRVDQYPGPITGANPSKNSRLASKQYTRDVKVYEYYKSHTLSDGVGARVDTDDRSKVVTLKRAILFLVPTVFFIAVGVYFIFKTYNSLRGQSKDEIEVLATNDETAASKPSTNGNVVGTYRDKNGVSHNIVKSRNSGSRQPALQSNLFEASSIYISFNRGNFPVIDYRIKFDFSDTSASFNFSELRKMGFKLKPINDCAVQVSYAEELRIVMCPISISDNDDSGVKLF